MRDGNAVKTGKYTWAWEVVSLPMRDGNRRSITSKLSSHSLLAYL